MSIGIFSSFLTRQLVSFSPPTVKLAPAKLRQAAVTAASNPDSAGSLSNETKKIEPPKEMSNSPGVSLEMQAFLGGKSDITGAEALKEVWAYIEEHNLQVCQSIARLYESLIVRTLCLFDFEKYR